MNCLKMHFVSIFTASAEVFIRCLVILLTRIFILRIIPLLKELKLQRTVKKSSSFPFLRHLQKKYIRYLAISRAWNYDLCTTSSQKNEVAQNYTLRRDSAHSNFYFAYNSILKGTRCATSC